MLTVLLWGLGRTQAPVEGCLCGVDEALGMRPLQAHCHRGLGMLYTATGQREQARAELANGC